MTRTEAELKILDKMKEIKEILLEYYPDSDYLSMSIIKHTDPEDNLFDLNTWSVNVHNADKNHPLSVYVSDGEVYQHYVGLDDNKVIVENFEI